MFSVQCSLFGVLAQSARSRRRWYRRAAAAALRARDRGENCVASRKVAGTKGGVRTTSAAIPVVRVALRRPSLAKAGFADTDSNAHLGLPFGRSSQRSTLRAGEQARGPDGLLRFTLDCQDLATR